MNDVQQSDESSRVCFGLIGFPLSHSFSQKYFREKFISEGLSDYSYELFELKDILELPILFKKENLLGVNVTIPYKQAVIPLLDHLSPEAREVGAVNTITRTGSELTGYNTDARAFFNTLQHYLEKQPDQALILGTGGAAKAVGWALNKLKCRFRFVSRNEGNERVTYHQLDRRIISTHHLIINTTPLGMSPHTDRYPDIDYSAITPDHMVYDLIYNPEKTLFLKHAEEQGARIKNGLEMLHLQAEYAWEIWKSHLDAA